jgi:hypothetical protein
MCADNVIAARAAATAPGNKRHIKAIAGRAAVVKGFGYRPIRNNK